MDSKLETLLEKTNMKEYEEYFLNGILSKIIGNSDKDKYKFIIELDTNLPVDTYLKLTDNLALTFFMYKEVKIKLKIKKMDFNLLGEYYKYYMEKYSVESPLLSMFLESPLELINDDFIITVSNKAEEMKLKNVEKNLEKDLEKAGFDIDIKIKIDEEKQNQIRQEIEKELVVKIDSKLLEKQTCEKIEEKVEETKKRFIPENYKRPPLIVDKDNDLVVMGKYIEELPIRLDTLMTPKSTVVIEGNLFGFDARETRSGLKIVSLKITDFVDSIYGTIFINDEEEYKLICSKLKIDSWYKFRAIVKDVDKFSQDISLNVRDITIIKKEKEEIIDDAPIKRVELHAHTMMSQMDGLIDASTLVKEVKRLGHNAVGITDHNGVQSFPDIYHFVRDYNKNQEKEEDKFKALYGTELTMIDDTIKIVLRGNDSNLMDNTYVVFDLETTGFNAGGGDSIIEIGAVKILNGEIIDKFDELINPGKKLSLKITEVTSITDAMLEGKPSEEISIKKFMEWSGDLPMVAHNAKFDVSFIEMAFNKYNLGKFSNMVIDTLELSRTLDNNFARHSLSALVKRYDIPFDEESHHRGDYDAEATAYVYHKMMKKLISRNIEKISGLDSLVSKDEIHKYGRPYHVNILAKNKIGLKNLFKIISLANTKYLYKTPRILRSEIENLKEGLLIGSGCYESEVFIEARSKSDEELTNIINFYDYVEVQPLDVYDHLLQMDNFGSKLELIEHIKKVIRVTKEAGKIIVATGDVHHLKKEDKMYREIIVNQKVPGGGRHPLARTNITSIPSQHFRTTREMLEDFNFLDKDLAYEIVVLNTNKIADMIEIIEVIIETKGIPFSPKIENSVETVNTLVYEKSKSWYGEPLPNLIKDRIEQELKGIIGGGFDVIYLIAEKLVKKSNDDGYLVGSRGSVGSSFVATMMGITEVNPLPAHYRCPQCCHSIFEDENNVSLGSIYSSGYDLPNMKCPKCNTLMIKDGQDMPFATFLGFNADKVPDIDLNFSGLNQADAHDYTKVLFGVDNVYRAGTIGTVAEKTAFGYVKGYCEDKHLIMRNAEIERRAMGCTGVKRTTGQHPGGIVVIPDYMDVFDFTPFQYPADDSTSAWRTTHFDYHAIDECVLKLDILGHDDPTVLRMLQDLSGIDVTKIDLGDSDTMKIFSSPNVLGVTEEQIMCPTGTLGVPEFGTQFVIQMLVDTKPKSFSELIKISGLSHGTDVWIGNAQELIHNRVCEFKDVIGCRDDIMVYLMYNGVEPIKAFKIMELVRKGKASKEKNLWKEYVSIMKEAGIVDWYINSCYKIKYMFPKAHAAAYVMSAFRIAWFKVHHPIWYYDAYFSIRCSDFDIEAMIKGYDEIKNKIIEIKNKGYEATNKDNAVLEVLQLSLEATARGIKFGNIDLNRSDAYNFIIDEDNKTLIPPFRTIEGLGITVAQNIISEREKRAFLSIEDLQKRGKTSSTIIEKMRMMGVLDGMDESSQLSLF